MTNAEYLEGQISGSEIGCGYIGSERAQSIVAELRAASKLADACRNSGDERIQAALAAFDRAKGG